MTDACRAAKSCASIAELLPVLGVKLAVIMVVILLFAALVLACAVWIAPALLRRDPWIGLRTRHPQPDPLSEVHGDIPTLDFFSAWPQARNRPRHPHHSAGSGATETGGRAIPSRAPAGGAGDGERR